MKTNLLWRLTSVMILLAMLTSPVGSAYATPAAPPSAQSAQTDASIQVEDALTRQFTFKGFPDAIAFVTRLAFDAEAADHHPDLQVSYKRVTVTWSTHDEGGVTEKDFEGARQANAVAAALPCA